MRPPFAEDLVLGVALEAAPEVTIDHGLAAQYLAVTGDPLRLPLSASASRAVTGRDARLVNPGLVFGVSIGQSTVATGRVIANLLYRNVALRRQVHVGETLRTVVTPRAAAWTRSGTERAKVLLEMDLSTAEGELLASYQRLALIPVARPDRLVTAGLPADQDAPLSSFAVLVPPDWSFGPEDAAVPGSVLTDPLADTVSAAREYARMTLNLAAAHRDARAGIDGRRLVYGGHTIALAQASVARVLPELLTVLAWRSCDHLGPVFEDDLLEFDTTVDARDGALADVTVLARAVRGAERVDVLRWRPVLLLGSIQ